MVGIRVDALLFLYRCCRQLLCAVCAGGRQRASKKQERRFSFSVGQARISGVTFILFYLPVSVSTPLLSSAFLSPFWSLTQVQGHIHNSSRLSFPPPHCKVGTRCLDIYFFCIARKVEHFFTPPPSSTRLEFVVPTYPISIYIRLQILDRVSGFTC